MTDLGSAFTKQFGRSGDVEIVSPGRVNLIGDHIDYCGGLVMPMAIDRGTQAIAGQNPDRVLRIYSERFKQRREISLEAASPSGDWSDFAIGVVSLLMPRAEHTGVDLYVTANIDAGGLSSSASFSLLIAQSLLWAANETPSTPEAVLSLARLCQQVEHEFVGVNCGIMDQASIALGGVLLLDCGSLKYESLPADFGDYQLVVMDTCHSRTLAGSKYNERVAEVTEIKQLLAPCFSLTELCELPITDLSLACEQLSNERLARRLCHVVTENQRVKQAAEALRQQNFQEFGSLMNASHASLQHDYEASGSALDTIVEISASQPGTLGARMTGGGFGGCALALVARDSVPQHQAAVEQAFEQATGVKPLLFTVQAAPGAGLR